MNWDQLQAGIRDAARTAFSDLLSAHPDETFYVFCLYTDSDGGTVVTSANTEEGYRAAIGTEQDEVSPATAAYMRWASAEWKYEACDGNLFAEINKALWSVPWDDGARVDKLVNVMTSALLELRKEDWYKALPTPPTLFVTMSDDDRAEEIENESAKVLNDEGRCTAFLQRYPAPEA